MLLQTRTSWMQPEKERRETGGKHENDKKGLECNSQSLQNDSIFFKYSKMLEYILYVIIEPRPINLNQGILHSMFHLEHFRPGLNIV